MSDTNVNFETTLTELNQLVEKLEQGGLGLEESLQYFERGMSLSQQCQQSLKEAEQKVQILSSANESKLQNYKIEDNK
ncbi:exodeoxyribonuclease VII small subunit [soil metagenome]